MKKRLLIFCFACINLSLLAQAPQKMSYQAIIRDMDDKLLNSQSIGVMVSILKDSDMGDVVYSERHTATTNQNGLVSLTIGAGEVISGMFSNIDWSTGSYYLKIDTDPTGGNDYTISGTSQLLSVPYALYAHDNSGDSDWTEVQPDAYMYTTNEFGLWSESFGDYLFYVNSENPLVNIMDARAWAHTDFGTGLSGQSYQGTGVHGYSYSGTGVWGHSEYSGNEPLEVGVRGVGNGLSFGMHGWSTDSTGIYGGSGKGIGIHGYTLASNKYAILGDGDLNSIGVMGKSKNKEGVKGESEKEAGVFGASKNKAGVYGESEFDVGVEGSSEVDWGTVGKTDYEMDQENLEPKDIGSGTSIRAGVYGFALKSFGGYFQSDTISGAFGLSLQSNGLVGATKTDNRDRAGVYGASKLVHGLYGKTDEAIGVLGYTKASQPDLNLPTDYKNFDHKVDNAATMGLASFAFGHLSQSGSVSGVAGLSDQSNGVVGLSNASDAERAGVKGLSSQASGVLGHSISGSGVRGKSDTGNAGEFEGEVHIENGGKTAKLWIEEMETDNNAPCLVWSGDKYVRKKDCWAVEEGDGVDYFVSSKGIKLKVGEDVVFQVNPDGTSYHKGFEFFEAGLGTSTPDGSTGMFITPDNGFVIYDFVNDEYLFHANPFGDAFAANSFYTGFLGANEVSSNVKNFRIDHPLDPENKYLIHTSMESNERLNMYSGNVITDDQGFAVVRMPEWFEALNEDFRYQLTVIGSFAHAIIADEVKNGNFTIQTNEPNIKVSWQVSGVRKDKWAQENPNIVEISKSVWDESHRAPFRKEQRTFVNPNSNSKN